MSSVVLKFASWKKPNDIFDAIKSGEKTVETRPASLKYCAVKKGDLIELLSLDTKEKIKRTVKFIHKYKSVAEMAEKEEVNKIIPGVETKEQLIKTFDILKKKWGKQYADKIETFGMVAIGI